MRKLVSLSLFLFVTSFAFASTNSVTVRLPQLQAEATITRDANGIAHIKAANDHDLYFLNGYVHAQDRLFQMDVSRRIASGTLAELLGQEALSQDAVFRILGLRRAAERSLPVYSKEVQDALEAYAAGVNAWVEQNGLPQEYATIEISKFEPWTALDTVSIAKLIAFNLSFDLDLPQTIAYVTYAIASQVYGLVGAPFDPGKYFSEDIWRSQPFTLTGTVPDAELKSGTFYPNPNAGETTAQTLAPSVLLNQQSLDRLKRFQQNLQQMPAMRAIFQPELRGGSNQWAVSGNNTTSGRPLLANDPHLTLDVPATWYPLHLNGETVNVAGNSFAGVPGIVLGHNDYVSWGATVNPMDETDIFLDQIRPCTANTKLMCSVHQGKEEQVEVIPVSFRRNVRGDGILDNLENAVPGTEVPASVMVMPRRNNGPVILPLDSANGIYLTIQYTGWSATREIEAFYLFNRARNLDDFRTALQYFDFGSQNFAYSDIHGNIAYFTGGEMPIRRDLQQGFVSGGTPPWFVRDGRNALHEWLPVQNPQPGQATPYEILRADEMPFTINPPAGWFVNANNDPSGTTFDNNPINQQRRGGGIYYLNPGYSQIRSARITELLKEKLAKGPVSREDMAEIQADVVLFDAKYFTPHIIKAAQNSQSNLILNLLVRSMNPRTLPAVQRLANWDFTTPTGIFEGYDSSDLNGVRTAPTQQESNNSVAATLYSLWRTRMISNTVENMPGVERAFGEFPVSALKNLFERFPTRRGIGASGWNFFQIPPQLSLLLPASTNTPEFRRDFLILLSMSQALDRLQGPDYAAAFNRSTNLDDYRWGKLHRIVFDNRLPQYSLPNASLGIPNPLGDALPGFPTDGGFEVVDASSHSARADGVNAFLYGSGASNRLVTEGFAEGMRGQTSLPGGISGSPFSGPLYYNLLEDWLTNEAYQILISQTDVDSNASSQILFLPYLPE